MCDQIDLACLKELVMNFKKIFIVIALASSFVACSTTQAPVVQSVEGVVDVDVTSYYNSVWFDRNSTKVADNFDTVLELNADYLKANPSALIQLQGNASEVGSREYNYNLGLRRTRAVAIALLNLGVNPKQIQEVSFGFSKKVSTKDRQASQRVDIVYTSGAPISYYIEQLPIVSTEDETVEFESISIKAPSQSSKVDSSSPSAIVPSPVVKANAPAASASSDSEAASIMGVFTPS